MAETVAKEHQGQSGRGGQTHFPKQGKHNLLVVTRGHAFARDPFYALFENNSAVEWSGVEHPAAQLMFTPQMAQHFSCYVLYDMPGIEFVRTGDRQPIFHEPPEFFKQGLLDMLEQGTPLVILHHACAAWPAWDTWAEIVGGRFLYQPAMLRGAKKPDSGYRLNVSHTVSPCSAHPITRNIAPFTLTDELYLFEVFEKDVEPLLTSDFTFTQENFYSAKRALEGYLNDQTGWSHEPSSNLVGWVKHYRNSPIIYLQCGDGASSYANPHFQALLANAIEWACSVPAREWARERYQRETKA